jgi:hypothetical protein
MKGFFHGLRDPPTGNRDPGGLKNIRSLKFMKSHNDSSSFVSVFDWIDGRGDELIIHSLNFGPRDKGFVRPEASSKAMRDMEDLMDQHLGLIFFVELIKPFGEDFNNIMRFRAKGHLQDA